MSDDSEHPALKGYSRFWEETKHVGGKILKWAAIGALVLGVISAVALGPAMAVLSMVPFVGTWLAGNVGAGITSAALLGAGIGGLFGAAKGLSGASNAADDAEDRRVELMERAVTLNAQRQALNNLRTPQMAGGMPPMGPGGMPLKDKGLRIS